MLQDDIEIFNKHSNFDVESLDSEAIRKQIKISLLQEMLKKKPHYAKYFTELEEEMDDHQLFLANHASLRAINDKLDPASSNAVYRNRLSSIFQQNNPNSVSLEQSNMSASCDLQALHTPKLTM